MVNESIADALQRALDDKDNHISGEMVTMQGDSERSQESASESTLTINLKEDIYITKVIINGVVYNKSQEDT